MAFSVRAMMASTVFSTSGSRGGRVVFEDPPHPFRELFLEGDAALRLPPAEVVAVEQPGHPGIPEMVQGVGLADAVRKLAERGQATQLEKSVGFLKVKNAPDAARPVAGAGGERAAGVGDEAASGPTGGNGAPQAPMKKSTPPVPRAKGIILDMEEGGISAEDSLDSQFERY